MAYCDHAPTCVSASRTLILCMDINRSTSAVEGASPSGFYAAEQQRKHRNRSNRLMNSSNGKQAPSRVSWQLELTIFRDAVRRERQKQKQNGNIPFSCSSPASELPAESAQSRDKSGQQLYGWNTTVSHPPATAKLRDKKTLKVYVHVQEDTGAAVKHVSLHRCDTNTPKAR